MLTDERDGAMAALADTQAECDSLSVEMDSLRGELAEAIANRDEGGQLAGLEEQHGAFDAANAALEKDFEEERARALDLSKEHES